jgi:uncharacterized membrane protein YphA (DoxX/SURF4 family)
LLKNYKTAVKMRGEFMNIALWVVQIILGLAFIMIGSMKVFQYEKFKAHFPSRGLVTLIGVAEMLGGLGLILPYATGIIPILTPIAALGLGVILILAAGLHAKRKENKGIPMIIIFLALAIFVAIGRW